MGVVYFRNMHVITGKKDIIEGVNMQSSNMMTLYTTGTCTINGTGQTGSLATTNCSMAKGCSVEGLTDSYGAGFNSLDGGVYAMLWTDKAIRLWFFPRSSIPESITNGDPDPGSFGVPLTNFEPASPCNLQQEIKDQKIVFDITFCGDWATDDFTDSGCPMSDPRSAVRSCVDCVATNPFKYRKAYWEINSIRIYQNQSDYTGPSKPSAGTGIVAHLRMLAVVCGVAIMAIEL